MKTQERNSPRLSEITQRLSRVLIILGLCVGVPHLGAWAQIDTGSLIGTVRDASGALVANATVTVRDEATGLTLSQGVNRPPGLTSRPLRLARTPCLPALLGLTKLCNRTFRSQFSNNWS